MFGVGWDNIKRKNRSTVLSEARQTLCTSPQKRLSSFFTSTLTGKITSHLFRTLAEFERNLI